MVVSQLSFKRLIIVGAVHRALLLDRCIAGVSLPERIVLA